MPGTVKYKQIQNNPNKAPTQSDRDDSNAALDALRAAQASSDDSIVSDQGIQQTEEILSGQTTSGGLQSTTQNLEDVTSQIEQIDRGIQTGFKEGGLMARKKSKKKK